MKIVKSSFLRLLCAFFALGIALLLCACSFEEEGRSKETAQLPSMKTMAPGSVFLTFGARFAPAHQFTAEEITWLEVPSRFMRKIICRLRLNEVSRQ